MGTWGSDSFENDDAADWVADFCDAPDPAVIVNTLSAIANRKWRQAACDRIYLTRFARPGAE